MESENDYRVQRLTNDLDRMEQVVEALEGLVRHVGQRAELYSDGKRRFGDPLYPYLPFSQAAFAKALLYVKKYDPQVQTFVDAGCGIGDKVVIAHSLGLKSCGIEPSGYLYRFAKRMMGLTDDYRSEFGMFIFNNLMEFDYRPFNIVFCHTPYQADEMQLQLEKRIFQQVGPGAYILMPRVMACPRHINFVCNVDGIQILRRQWKKPK